MLHTFSSIIAFARPLHSKTWLLQPNCYTLPSYDHINKTRLLYLTDCKNKFWNPYSTKCCLGGERKVLSSTPALHRNPPWHIAWVKLRDLQVYCYVRYAEVFPSWYVRKHSSICELLADSRIARDSRRVSTKLPEEYTSLGILYQICLVETHWSVKNLHLKKAKTANTRINIPKKSVNRE